MRRHLSLLVGLALQIGPAFAGTAQTKHITPFTGIWKLNVAKSTFDPGPPFKSFMLTFAPDGTRKLDLVGADGKALRARLPWSDGKTVPVKVIEGMEEATAISKIEGHEFHDIWSRNGKVIERVHGVVSANGRTLTITVDGPLQQGGSFHNRLQFDKQ